MEVNPYQSPLTRRETHSTRPVSRRVPTMARAVVLLAWIWFAVASVAIPAVPTSLTYHSGLFAVTLTVTLLVSFIALRYRLVLGLIYTIPGVFLLYASGLDLWRAMFP